MATNVHYIIKLILSTILHTKQNPLAILLSTKGSVC